MKTKRFLKRLVLPVILLIFCAAAFFLYQRYLIYFHAAFTGVEFAESNELLDNPYQGFYHIYGYRLSEDSDSIRKQIEQSVAKDQNALVLLEINLADAREAALSKPSLAALDTIFSQWSDAGKQLIVRFLYDWNGNARETEPDDIAIILEHMSQCAEIVNQYTDSIYLLQGIFVGNVGEMNNSNYMSETDMCRLIEHLAAVTDPAIYLAVRTPEHWRMIAGSGEPTDAAEAFTGSLNARLGLFNDGLLGSAEDLGTYAASNTTDASQLPGKWTREKEIRFQHSLCAYVPNGGEVVIDNPLNDLEAAIQYFSQIHVSYLDMDYDSDVLNKWKNSIYEGDGCFHGSNGYDYIQAHLGYRYVLRAQEFLFNNPYAENATLQLTIENIGFSVSYKNFPVNIHVRNQDSLEVQTFPIDSDTRLWADRNDTILSVLLPIRTLGVGNYEIYLDIKDPASGRLIQLANDLPLTDDGYLLGQIEIAKPF